MIIRNVSRKPESLLGLVGQMKEDIDKKNFI